MLLLLYCCYDDTFLFSKIYVVYFDFLGTKLPQSIVSNFVGVNPVVSETLFSSGNVA
jgi:hypothetical protein